MLTILGIHNADAGAALRLLRWIEKLDGSHDHDICLIFDRATDTKQIELILQAAGMGFRAVRHVVTDNHVRGWPDGPNSLFKEAATFAQGEKRPFLWLEADCVPLCPEWLNQIEAEYTRCGQPVMACQYKSVFRNEERVFCSGIAVYPEDTITKLMFPDRCPWAWEIFNADMLLANSKHTELIQHFWGQPGLPPTFAESRTPSSSVNTFTPENLKPGAVLFHRNKDGTLIRIMSRKLFPDSFKPIVVVFHVCATDSGLAIEHAKWMVSMKTKWPHDALLAYDLATPQDRLQKLKSLLEKCFKTVDLFTYPTPAVAGWPAACNWAWQHVANRMSQGESPWLWMEADAIALTPDWLERIQTEYDTAGRGFMGPVVKQMGHANGVMVYPANTPDIATIAMRAVDKAWDYVGGSEITRDCHDASALFCHIWTIQNDQACPVGGGDVPLNMTLDQAQRWVPKGSVLLHRIKDDSALRLLQSGAWKP